MQIANQEENLS